MSNWRINFGVGPVRYTRSIGGRKRKLASSPEPSQDTSADRAGRIIGHVFGITLLVSLVVCCCFGDRLWSWITE